MGTFGSIASRLTRCAPHLVRGLAHRRDLALLEMDEAVRKSVVTLVVALVAALFFALAVASLTLVVAAIYWDTSHRVAAVSIVAGAEALIALGGIVWIWLGWRRWQFFRTTREQMERDTECLTRIFNDKEEKQ